MARPSKAQTVPGADRLLAFRERQAAAGGRRIEISLGPEAAAALEKLAPARGAAAPLIERLILAEAARQARATAKLTRGG